MRELPRGTVTFLFTDIEGSTRLLQSLGAGFRPLVERHFSLLMTAVQQHGGTVVRTEGDGLFAVFESARQAVAAAADAQRFLSGESWPGGHPVKVRMGLHSGEGILGGGDYVGLDVHRAARIADAGHGGQVLVSSGTRGLVEGTLAGGMELRPLGRHRLKDFDHPEELFQLVVEGLPSSFPSLRARQAATTLPLQRTSFIGRERERSDLRSLVVAGSIVTLLGPGGIGKTRLAVEVAREAADRFPDGVFFVDLSPVVEAALVPSKVAAALGVKEDSGQAMVATLSSHLADRDLLLLLDNLEQLVEAAPMVQEMVGEGGSALLVTSRVPLRLRGERRYPVDGLGVDPAAGDALRLFIDRAQAVDPTFQPTEDDREVVADICARLDGLPLAIELAASQLGGMPLSMLRERLGLRLGVLTAARDAPARQRTLRATIAWSHDLLSPEERVAFRRLGVFAGGWTPASMASVVDPDGSMSPDLVALVGSLMEKSLIRRGSGDAPRFSMLEMIREFAIERLEVEEDAEAVRELHAAYFLGMAEHAAPNLLGDDQSWLDDLEREHDNLRAALRWFLARERAEESLRLGGALWRFWQLRGHLREGRRSLERSLSCPGALQPTRARGRALVALGGVAYWQGDLPVVRSAYSEALSVFEGIDDRAGVAEAMYNLSFIPQMEGDYERAREMFTETLRLYEELDDGLGQALAREGLGVLALLQGDPSSSLSMMEEAYAYYRAEGRGFNALEALTVIAGARINLGDLAEADRALRTVIDEHMAHGNLTGIAQILKAFGDLAVAENDLERALRLGGAADAIHERLGGALMAAVSGSIDPRTAALGLLDPERIKACWDEGRSMSVSEAVAYARREEG